MILGAMTGRGVDPDVALFAKLVREDEEAERRAADDQRRRRDEAERGERLRSAKDDAARHLKDLRAKGAPVATVAEAEAAYRAALAEVVAMESGQRPAWALPADVDARHDDNPEE